MNRRALLLGLVAAPFLSKVAEAAPAWDSGASLWPTSDPPKVRVEWSDDGVVWNPMSHTREGDTLVIDNRQPAAHRYWQVRTDQAAWSAETSLRVELTGHRP